MDNLATEIKILQSTANEIAKSLNSLAFNTVQNNEFDTKLSVLKKHTKKAIKRASSLEQNKIISKVYSQKLNESISMTNLSSCKAKAQSDEKAIGGLSKTAAKKARRKVGRKLSVSAKRANAAVANETATFLPAKKAPAILTDLINVSTVQQSLKPTQTSEDPLPADTALLIQLLSMHPNMWINHVIKLSMERDILVSTGSIFNFNPVVLKRFNQKNQCSSLRPKDDDKKMAKPMRLTGEPASFEFQVNTLLYGNQLPKDAILAKKITHTTDKYTRYNYEALNSFVDALLKAGKGRIVEGEIRMHPRRPDTAYMSPGTGEKDIVFGRISLRQCAMSGDRVQAFVITETEAALRIKVDDVESEKEEHLVGFVIKILKRDSTNRNCVCTVGKKRKNFVTFSSRDQRIPPSKCFIQNETPEYDSTKLHMVKIIDWLLETPIVQYIKELGPIGDLTTENQAILIGNNLIVPKFEETAVAFIPNPETYCIPSEEIARRSDFRDLCIFTIDPVTAQDLDDALSCRKLANGNWQVGVHISDVSYYVLPNSELNNHVQETATSIYLVDACYHMLPPALCQICSLLPGVDKLAFSVLWELNDNAQILSTEFCRSIINSCAKLSYEEAQLMIDDKPDITFSSSQLRNGYTRLEIAKVIRQLNHFAQIMRKQRFANGALMINQPKIYFDLDPITGEPTAFKTYVPLASNFMIEEFMLLANISVATKIHEIYPNTAILRKHDGPKQRLMKKLAEKLDCCGIKIDATSSLSIQKSLHKAMQKDPKRADAIEVVLNVLLAKPMNRARYLCSYNIPEQDLWHYALSVPIYTHFTSPIRRYPDIMVHRLLAAALDSSPLESFPSSIECDRLANVSNVQKLNAKLASNDAINMYFRRYVQQQGRVRMRAAVFDVSQFVIEVILINTGHLIKLRTMSIGKSCEVHMDKKTSLMIATFTFDKPSGCKRLSIRMFDQCSVILEMKNDTLKGTLDLDAEQVVD